MAIAAWLGTDDRALPSVRINPFLFFPFSALNFGKIRVYKGNAGNELRQPVFQNAKIRAVFCNLRIYSNLPSVEEANAEKGRETSSPGPMRAIAPVIFRWL